MTRNFGFIFAKPNTEDFETEKTEIHRYSHINRVLIDRIISNTPFVELSDKVRAQDVVIIASMASLPKNTLMAKMLEKQIRFYFIKEELSVETVEDYARLTNKKIPSNNHVESDKKRPGRKAGVLIHSGFDNHLGKIKELYALGLSLEKICKHIGFGTKQSLSYYLKSRGIDDQKVS